MLNKPNKDLPSDFLALIVTICFVASASPAFSHGTVTSPPSRVYTCYLENPESPDSPACVSSVADFGTQHLYDWNAIRQGEANENHTAVVPNGQLGSGGDPAKYGGMDQVRSDWVKTSVTPGPYTVTWTNSAPHATEYYQVYITNEDWTPNQPLRWDNITLLVETPFSLAETVVDIPVVLPNRTGHHVIYSVWQRADSPEAFYSASDVDFGGGGSGADDKKVLVSEDLEVIRDFKVNEDIYFPSLANGEIQNLTIDADGKVSTDAITLQISDDDKLTNQYIYTINKFSFSIGELKGEEQVAREGLYFENGTKLKAVEALLLDNSIESGEDRSSINLKIYRVTKISKVSSPDLIFEVNGSKTPNGKFESFSSDQLISKGSGTVNNEEYIYYAEILFCNECDFREVKFISFWD